MKPGTWDSCPGMWALMGYWEEDRKSQPLKATGSTKLGNIVCKSQLYHNWFLLISFSFVFFFPYYFYAPV